MNFISFKFKEGDRVRISKVKCIFEKGYLFNWIRELFIIFYLVKGFLFY